MGATPPVIMITHKGRVISIKVEEVRHRDDSGVLRHPRSLNRRRPQSSVVFRPKVVSSSREDVPRSFGTRETWCRNREVEGAQGSPVLT